MRPDAERRCRSSSPWEALAAVWCLASTRACDVQAAGAGVQRGGLAAEGC